MPITSTSSIHRADGPAAPAAQQPSGQLPPRSDRHTEDDGKGGLARPIRHLLVWWNFGVGDIDTSSPKKITGAQVRAKMLPKLQVGDVILSGNEGKVTHASIYVGDGRMVHSMASESTQRSHLQRAGDLVLRPFRGLAEAVHLRTSRIGVFEEGVDEFFERFYRETWVVMRPVRRAERRPDHDAGVARARALVGKPYDWDFVGDNDSYYCSEVIREYYWAALGDAAPRVGARSVDKPLLERDAIVDPEDFLSSPDLIPVAWNTAANKAVAERVGRD